MKKVYTLTFHWATNYGAVLQAYALQKYLLNKGYDAKLIDYVPKGYQKTLLGCLRARSIGQLQYNVREYRKEHKMEQFRNRYLKRTKKFHTSLDLQEQAWGKAVYICGSDQIWNPHFTMKGEGKQTSVYYFGFVPKNCQKLSYAASFGVTTIDDDMAKFIQPYLCEFDQLTVRENTAKQILEHAGNEAEVVCDPVFLLERTYYQDIASTSEHTESKGNVFSYILHQNQKEAKEVAKFVSDTLGAKTVDGTKGLTIEAWLSNIRDAKFVVTNSFHATAFALLFHIPFVTVLIPGSGMNDRITTLLEKVNLQERAVLGWNQEKIEKIVKDEIAWEQVDGKVSAMRAHAERFLEI